MVQIGPADRVELKEQNELSTLGEQAEDSGGVVRWKAAF